MEDNNALELGKRRRTLGLRIKTAGVRTQGEMKTLYDTEVWINKMDIFQVLGAPTGGQVSVFLRNGTSVTTSETFDSVIAKMEKHVQER